MLKTEAALAALHAHLEAAAGLPGVTRNDNTLSGFAESGTAGVRWKLALMDEDIVTAAHEIGDPPQHELWVGCDLILAIEGEPGSDRDQVFASATAALAGALYPGGLPLALPEFESIEIDNRVVREHLAPVAPGTAPITTVHLSLALFVTAPTPFG